ncbi:MAG: Xaa-Pro peptidase family protein [Planctomycetota bacterium]
MLTVDGCKARRKRLFERLDPSVDWVILADPQHLMYFANYFQSPFVFRSTNANAMLLFSRAGESILVADNLLGVFAELAHVDRTHLPVWYAGKASAPHREGMLVEQTLKLLEQTSGTTLGVEHAAVPAGIVAGLQSKKGGKVSFPAVDSAIHELKRRKDEDEMALMRRSMKAGEAGFAAALQNVRAGMTERDVFSLVERAAMEAAGEQVLVYGDFVSGARCEQVGGPPTDRVIEKGDLFLLDFSVVVAGYRGDFANTFVVDGAPTDTHRRLYEACIDAMNAGEEQLRAGVPCVHVDRAVRNSLAAKHLAENFPGHAGHGLGLGHPDPPYIVPESTDTLLAGDVVTLEPGQYIKGVAGMRLREELFNNGKRLRAADEPRGLHWSKQHKNQQPWRSHGTKV